MAEEKTGLLKRSPTDNIIILYLFTILLITFGQLLGMLLGFVPFMTGSDVASTFTMYFECIGIWILVLNEM